MAPSGAELSGVSYAIRGTNWSWWMQKSAMIELLQIKQKRGVICGPDSQNEASVSTCPLLANSQGQKMAGGELTLQVPKTFQC